MAEKKLLYNAAKPSTEPQWPGSMQTRSFNMDECWYTNH
jgi:hypothetical protein